MKNWKKIFVITTLLVCVVGCGKVPTLKNGEDAVASLDKGGVSVNTLYNTLKDKYGVQMLIDLIDTEIFNNMFEETDEEKNYIKQQVEDSENYAKEQKVDFSYLLKLNGYDSTKAFKDSIRLEYRRNLAVNNYIEDTIKDKEIQKYYDSEIYGDIKVKHILIAPDTSDDMTSEEKQKADKDAKNEALDIIKKLDNGEDFSKLAKKYSDDSTTASKGGDLGWISTGDMVEEFDAAAFKLEKGKYTTSPVKTTYGYHIIYKVDEKAKPKLKDVKSEIVKTLAEEKLKSDPVLYYDTLEDIRKDAGLNIEDKDLKNEYSIYMKNLKNQVKNQSQAKTN